MQRLRPMLEQMIKLNGRSPQELTADAGYASEANFAALAEAGVHAVIALRRYRRDEPPARPMEACPSLRPIPAIAVQGDLTPYQELLTAGRCPS